MRARVFISWVVVAATAALFAACATGIISTEPDGGPGDASCSGSGCGGDGGGGGDSGDGGLPNPDGGGCAPNKTACVEDGGQAACVDTKTDTNHCGSCTNACLPQLQACDAGVCESTCAPKTLCIPDGGAPDAGDAGAAPHCADLQNDHDDCGSCGVVCPQNGTCTSGVCKCGSGTQGFSYTGSTQNFVVPCGITSVTITAAGGQGANAQDVLSSVHSGGLGGKATGTLAVTPGETLVVSVGGQGSTSGTGGWNGGSTGGSSTAGGGCSGGPAAGGGGMSDVRKGGTAWANVVIAAAGGGGSGRSYCNSTCRPCGCGGGSGGGGGLTGVNGGAASNCGYGYPGSGVNGGHGGGQSTGGAGGTGDSGGTSGTAGAQGSGGAGAAGTYDVAGGGGGGGYYGGGGGGGASSGSGVGGGGGAGGASYIGGVTGGSTTAAIQSGDGTVTITW